MRRRKSGVVGLVICFVAVMHLIFGRQFRFAIRSTQFIIISFMQCWEDWINVENKIDGNEK